MERGPNAMELRTVLQEDVDMLNVKTRGLMQETTLRLAIAANREDSLIQTINAMFDTGRLTAPPAPAGYDEDSSGPWTHNWDCLPTARGRANEMGNNEFFGNHGEYMVSVIKWNQHIRDFEVVQEVAGFGNCPSCYCILPLEHQCPGCRDNHRGKAIYFMGSNNWRAQVRYTSDDQAVRILDERGHVHRHTAHPAEAVDLATYYDAVDHSVIPIDWAYYSDRLFRGTRRPEDNGSQVLLQGCEIHTVETFIQELQLVNPGLAIRGDVEQKLGSFLGTDYRQIRNAVDNLRRFFEPEQWEIVMENRAFEDNVRA